MQNAYRAIRPLIAQAGHPPIGFDQVAHRCVQHQRHLRVKQRLGQPRHQRAAHHQPRAARAPQTVQRIPPDQRKAAPGGRARAAEIEQGADIGAVDHHAAEHQMRRQRRAQRCEVPAQPPTVIFHHVQNPAVPARTLVLAMVIGRDLAQPIAQLAVVFEKLQRLARGIDEGLQQPLIRAFADRFLQIGQYCLPGVVTARIARGLAQRNKDRRARQRCGATELRLFLDHHHIEPHRPGGTGRGKAGRARADDDHIGFGWFSHLRPMHWWPSGLSAGRKRCGQTGGINGARPSARREPWRRRGSLRSAFAPRSCPRP